MANKELLETIRKEIINRIDKRHLSEQAKNELVSILSKLSDLEKDEKPMNSNEGLEEEFIRYIHEKDAEVSERSESTYAQEDLEDIARHFAKWGAEHLATPAK